MNVFVIPSWYPSESNWLNGIFIKVQTLSLAKHYPDSKFAISLWGQNDEDYLLYVKKPISSFRKLLKSSSPDESALLPNVKEYFTPAFSFHQRIKGGNIKKKIEANIFNLSQFQIHSGKVDVIHAHINYPAGVIARELSKKFKIPYILTEHMAPFPQKYHLDASGKMLPEIAESMRDASKLLVVSNYLKEQIDASVPGCNIEVVPNFINTPTDTLFTKESKTTFCYANSIAKKKGIEELIRAWALVDQPNCQLKIAGSGPDLAAMQELSESIGSKNPIIWMGELSKKEVLELMQTSDCHILTSKLESFGVSYIEAMAAGIPSIAAPFGGPLDIINPGTGRLVKDLSAEAIANEIKWFIQHKDQFKADEIKAHFSNFYSSEALVPRIMQIYQSATLS
ncbi:glycosyltransferase [Fulvivirga ligni]|uniref:glycosyltransferase n=1 Tax=Fulvivirga ligni TaxID=2904246 RepID=UPI001F1CB883|nr:glycosyltransferase [Fulvivirga ligni]UII23070.1 glycosyltransferase [Fulvivirga ligni]